MYCVLVGTHLTGDGGGVAMVTESTEFQIEGEEDRENSTVVGSKFHSQSRTLFIFLCSATPENIWLKNYFKKSNINFFFQLFSVYIFMKSMNLF